MLINYAMDGMIMSKNQKNIQKLLESASKASIAKRSMRSFIESFSKTHPTETQIILEGYSICYENEILNKSEENKGDINMSIPDNATPNDIRNIKTATDNVLTTAEKAAAVKQQANNAVKTSVDALKKTNENIAKTLKGSDKNA